MLYQISTMYKRDTSFTLCEAENTLQFSDVQNCKIILSIKDPLKYQTDRIDDYISQYDILPTIGGLLVSTKFKMTFSNIESTDVQYIPVIICDENGKKCEQFFCMNILNSISVLDKKRSIYLPSKWDKSRINIIQPFYYNDNMANNLIVRMKECNSFIIVSESFKELAEAKKLKGITFNPEGKSFYTKSGLEDAREKMNKWLANIGPTTV